MRIAQIIESTSGGSVRCALALTQGLASKGEEVTFIYSPVRADSLFEEDLRNLKKCRKIAFSMQRAVGIHDLWSVVALYRLLKKTGPYDILHAHSSKAGALARLVGVFFPAMRVIYTPHAFVTMASGASRFYGLIEKVLSFFTDFIIVVSEGERKHASCDLGISEHRIKVIPNGVSLPFLATRGEARSRMGYSEKEKVVGFVGRLSSQKNPTRLVEAFALAAVEHKNLRLAVVGSGSLLEQLKKKAEIYGVSERIKIWEGQDARLFMSGFDVLFCSSDYEGLPLVFIEALQASIPIVSTPVGGTPECVLQGKTGFVAKDFETGSLAFALKSYLQLDVTACKEMAAAALRQGDFFTVRRMTASTLDFYRMAVEQS
ncbi:MAG TPA: glycosyltransferase family 1 protein [Rhodospirillaceae bacterium]|nr:glycosyltransferase family 1 protein [Rhodospirillaceae bacterium]